MLPDESDDAAKAPRSPMTGPLPPIKGSARTHDQERRDALVPNSPPVERPSVRTLDEWDTKAVCEWLRSEYLSDLTHPFGSAGIVGIDLLYLDSTDLDQLGLDRSLAARLKLKRSLHGLRAQYEALRDEVRAQQFVDMQAVERNNSIISHAASSTGESSMAATAVTMMQLNRARLVVFPLDCFTLDAAHSPPLSALQMVRRHRDDKLSPKESDEAGCFVGDLRGSFNGGILDDGRVGRSTETMMGELGDEQVDEAGSTPTSPLVALEEDDGSQEDDADSAQRVAVDRRLRLQHAEPSSPELTQTSDNGAVPRLGSVTQGNRVRVAPEDQQHGPSEATQRSTVRSTLEGSPSSIMNDQAADGRVSTAALNDALNFLTTSNKKKALKDRKSMMTPGGRRTFFNKSPPPHGRKLGAPQASSPKEDEAPRPSSVKVQGKVAQAVTKFKKFKKHASPSTLAAPSFDKEKEQSDHEIGPNSKWRRLTSANKEEALDNEVMPQIELFLRQLERGQFAEERLERMEHTARVRHLLLPQGRVVLAMNCVVASLIIFYAIVTPLRIAFSRTCGGEFLKAKGGWWAFDMGATCVFALDIVLTFFTAIDEEGTNETFILDRRVIARAYLKFWFWLDLAATIPFDLVLRSAAANLGFNRLLRLVRLFKLIRIVRLSSLSQSFDSELISVHFFRLVKLLVTLMAMWHYIGCSYW